MLYQAPPPPPPQSPRSRHGGGVVVVTAPLGFPRFFSSPTNPGSTTRTKFPRVPTISSELNDRARLVALTRPLYTTSYGAYDTLDSPVRRAIYRPAVLINFLCAQQETSVTEIAYQIIYIYLEQSVVLATKFRLFFSLFFHF